MPIRTAQQYRDGLSDGRRVFYKGERVPDVSTFAEFDRAIDHSAHAYRIADSAPELAVRDDGDGPFAAIYSVPHTVDDVVHRGRLVEAIARLGAGTIVLKEVGSDALLGLLRSTAGDGEDNAVRYHNHVLEGDVALAVAQSDVKGNRSAGPGSQADPDLYVHVVAEDADSITVRGAKVHTSFSANADELLVLPTRAMGPGDESYAVSFAVPIDTDGLSLYVSPFLHGDPDPFERPISSRHKLLESLTVFEDVRVPKDRVFLNGDSARAGDVALSFVSYHRFTAVNYKLPLLDAFVGAAILVADANGISNAVHVKAKITELITYAETVRGLAELAALRSVADERGIFVPDPLLTNMSKYHFAHHYHGAVATILDLAGGLVVTGPGGADWASPEVRPILEKYLASAVPAEQRLRIINLISDLAASQWGGYQSVLATHAEGSQEAERMQILRSYDPERARQYALSLVDNR